MVCECHSITQAAKKSFVTQPAVTAAIRELEKELEQYRREEIPYTQIAKEINSQYPEIGKLILARGAEVKCDSLNTSKGLVLVTESGKPLNEQTRGKLENWLKIRLGDSTAVVISR